MNAGDAFILLLTGIGALIGYLSYGEGLGAAVGAIGGVAIGAIIVQGVKSVAL